MLVLFKKNGELFVKCKLNLRDSIKCNDIVFDKCVNKVELVDPEVVSELLTINANIKLFVAGKFLKVNLGTYYDMISKKKYIIEEVKEQKLVEESKPVVSQPEPEPEVEEDIVESEQPKKDNSKHNKSNNDEDNKKKRHKQNNNQGGDK